MIAVRVGYFKLGTVWLVYRWTRPWRQEEVIAHTKAEALKIAERIL